MALGWLRPLLGGAPRHDKAASSRARDCLICFDKVTLMPQTLKFTNWLHLPHIILGRNMRRCGSMAVKDEHRQPFEIVARVCSMEDSQISPVAFVLGAPSSVERKLIPATSVCSPPPPRVTHEKNDFLHQAQSELAWPHFTYMWNDDPPKPSLSLCWRRDRELQGRHDGRYF